MVIAKEQEIAGTLSAEDQKSKKGAVKGPAFVEVTAESLSLT